MGGASIFSIGTQGLDGNDLKLYEALVSRIKAVAAGELASSSFIFDLTSLGFSGTSFDLNKVMMYALVNLPYDLYWYEKTAGYNILGSGNQLTINMMVDSAYSVSGSRNTTNVDTSKTSLPLAAAKNAKDIVEEVKNNEDTKYKRLTAYKEKICELVTYDHAAAGTADPSSLNPWQLIYVFDGDDNTNVVCEGYSKAFQYLCDLDGELDCYIAEGFMAGGTGGGAHMWNVVRLDNKSYLADITNSDSGSVGADGSLFIAGYNEKKSTSSYLSGYESDYEDTAYVYKNKQGSRTAFINTLDIRSMYGDILDISDTDYVPESSDPGPGEPENTDFVYRIIDGVAKWAKLTAYNGSAEEVVVPSNIGGYDIKVVGKNSFKDNNIVKKITLSEGIEMMEPEAIQNCAALEELDLPASFVVSDNENLGVGCMPKGCAKLSVITVPSDSDMLCVEDNVLYSKDKTVLLYYPNGRAGTDFTIPAGVTRIASDAFAGNNNLKSVTMADSVVSVGYFAFDGCGGLESLVISQNCTSIGQYALNGTLIASLSIPASLESIDLRGAMSLESVEVNEDNAVYSSDDGVLLDKAKKIVMFIPPQKTGDYTVPDTVTLIKGASVCSLNSITVPALTVIEEGCFKSIGKAFRMIGFDGSPAQEYAKEKELTFDPSRGEIEEKTLDSGTFGDGLTWTINTKFDLTISGNGKMETDGRKWYYNDRPWKDYIEGIRKVIIEEGVTEVASDAFSGCLNLIFVSLPSTVDSIGDYAFSQCPKLKELALPASVKVLGMSFITNTGIEGEINIPATVISMDAAFWDNMNISAINVDANNPNYSSDNGVLYTADKKKLLKYPAKKSGDSYTVLDEATVIAVGAFMSSGIKSIHIGNSVTSIESRALADCNALESVYLGRKVSTIADGAFMACGALKKIVLPYSVKSIGGMAFADSGIRQITIPVKGSINIDDNAFGDIEGLIIYGTKDSGVEAYALGHGYSFKALSAAPSDMKPDHEPSDDTEDGSNDKRGDDANPPAVEDKYYDGISESRKIDLVSANAVISRIKTKVYDGNRYYPVITVTAKPDSGKVTLVEGADYTVEYKNNLNAGAEGRVIVKGKGRYTGEISKEFTISKKPIKSVKIVAGGMSVGSKAVPPIYVYDGNTLLENGEDYTLSYDAAFADSKGKKTVRVTGQGNYTGSKSVKLTVYSAENVLDSANTEVNVGSVDFTGKAQRPAVTVKYNGIELDSAFYTVKYTNNTNVGTGFVTVKGRKGYAGSAVGDFKIKAVQAKLDIKKDIPAKTFNGKAQKPKVTVVTNINGKEIKLKAGRDYILFYGNNLHATDKAEVIVRGMGNYARSGEKRFGFTIYPINIKKVSVKGNSTKYYFVYAKRILEPDIDYQEGNTTVDAKGRLEVPLIGLGDFRDTETVKKVKK